MGLDIYENIKKGKYQPGMEYPVKPKKPFLKKGHTSESVIEYYELLKRYEEYNKLYLDLLDQWHKENTKRFNVFRADCIVCCGLAGHDKADKAFQMAYDNAGGNMTEVIDELDQLADLLI